MKRSRLGVQDGRRCIEETLDAVVTGVPRTVAGCMIVARPEALEKDGAAR